MNQIRICKKIFESKPEGSEKLRKHKLKCLEDEDNYLQALKIMKRLVKKANNRENWAFVICACFLPRGSLCF
jgi:hypothetical protein